MLNSTYECESLVRSINSDIDSNEEFLKNPQEQYQQRNKYIEIVDYAIQSGELYHLYDIWQIYARGRNQATRGFFLDLWDIYEQRDKDFFLSHQRERDILRFSVAQAYNQFDEILNAEAITAPERWRAYIQELFVELWSEDGEHLQQKRKLLYSMSNLYVYLYHPESLFARQEKESLIIQLAAVREAKVCRVEEGNFSIDLKKIFTTTQNNDSQQLFTLSFLYLYRFTCHFGKVDLDNFAHQVVSSLQTEKFISEVGAETAVELLSQLLRYWGANSPLIKLFLDERLDFKFYEYQESEDINLPTPYGTDNFVYTIGAPDVGKTYLFHAMEDCTNTLELALSLKYLDIKASEVDKKRDTNIWKAGEQLEPREKHLQSKVHKLCRFTFYEIADTQITEDTITRWQSLQGYFERRLPAAIILIFSPEEQDNLKSYSLLVNLLDKLAQEGASQCNRNIPIYFVFNKSDVLVNNLHPQADEQMLSEFQSYLNSENSLSTGFNFLSLRYQKQVQQLGALKVANRTQACCSNLAFLAQLNQDLQKVAPVINNLLKANFTNLNFIYTCSLFQEDKQYNSLKTLWSDLNSFIIQATRQEIKKYYQQEFKDKLDSDFIKITSFCNTAKNVTSFGVSQEVFEQLNQASTPQQFTETFKHLTNVIKQNKQIQISDVLSLIPEVNKTVKSQFIREKNRFSTELDTALGLNLKELGIPIERKQIEINSDNHIYPDFPVKEIEFIDPNTINYYDYIWQFYRTYPNVDTFIQQSEYNDFREKIKNIFYEAISNYNRNKSENYQIKVDKDNLEIIIEQLPKQLQAIDNANRNEAFEALIREKYLFSDALTMTTALCPIQCGKFTQIDRDLIQASSTREQTVFNKLCQFTDLDQANKYCQLLSNYLPKYPKKPKYPQFLLVKRHISNKIQVELDEIKIKVIQKLAAKSEEQQKLLLGMIKILLQNRHQFERVYKNISNEEYLDKLYFAKYLLQMLQSQGLRVNEFQEKPQETIEHINNTTNRLIDIIKRSQSNTNELNLDGIREDYKRITLIDRWVLNQRDISQAKELEIELKTASSIYTQIFNLIDRDEEVLKTLLSHDIAQKFTFLASNDYNQDLRDYEQKRKLLIILERLEYLRTSQWVEDLKFREYIDAIWGYLTSANPKELKQSFTEEIDKLLTKEL